MSLKSVFIKLKKHWKLIVLILYVVSPIDLIPDILMPAGFIDDAIVVLSFIVELLAKAKKRDQSSQFEDTDSIQDGEIVDE